MTERALTFGSVAAAYERYRLGYSEEVVDRIEAYARRPVRTALEIGAGTGKATRVVTGRGISVTAVEPDADMVAELRRCVGGEVRVVGARFEELPAGLGGFDLVYAAAALHWTDPATRWQRIAGLLVPGGVVASFGGIVTPLDEELRARVDAVLRPAFGEAEPLPEAPPEAELRWPGTELLASPLFADVEQQEIERRPVLAAAEVVGQLATVSALLILPADRRERLLADVLAVLPEQVPVLADVTLHLARRAG